MRVHVGETGHYHVPTDGRGYCQAAIVVKATVDEERIHPQVVNISLWTSTGDTEARLGVLVKTPERSDDRASFHLVTACPDGR